MVFLATFLPILFKIIIPAVAQTIIRQQGIPIKSGTANTTDAHEVLVAVNTTINTPLGITIDSFPIEIYHAETHPYTPFLNISVPTLHANKLTDVSIDTTALTVLNNTELVSWANQLVDSTEMPLSIRGTPSVHLGSLSLRPRVDRDIKIAGLQGLRGFGIRDIQLILPADKLGHNVVGTANVPNWGVLRLNVGNVSLNVFTGDVRIGLITLFDVSLAPGNNTVRLNGTVDIPAIVANLGRVIKSQAGPLSRGLVEVNVTGNGTIMNGRHITYVEDIIRRRKFAATLSITTLLGDVLSGVVGGGSTDIVPLLGDILGNKSFIDHVAGHWNISGNSTGRGKSKSSSLWDRSSLMGS
ncbi:hypothetical protein QQS21_003241 [Conoideocrella luteorostrata]|uniref:Uncharacterized protein n=1 Tax=Conoideocrella luteorostrata TaxID=1105319 RepID=A0AAJ0CWE8_9HYPO|nr:hypothetical protein QQS21_003241 [Conoideocrella luteorostrata]